MCYDAAHTQAGTLMSDKRKPAGSQDGIEQIVQEVQKSAKYHAVNPDLIRRIASRELENRRNPKEAIKATKNKLHQIAGAYFESDARYAVWLEELRQAAQTADMEQFREACIRIMRHHASTRERLATLSSFYTTTLASIQPVRSVLDLAGGLNPLAIPWMPLANDATYHACDIYTDMAEFLNGYFGLLQSFLPDFQGSAGICDLVTEPPQQAADLALLLKAIPPLEQLDKQAGRRLLQSLDVRYALVSFPARSLSGRNKQMAENYEAHFRDLTRDEAWSIQRFEFPSEIAFLVELRSTVESLKSKV